MLSLAMLCLAGRAFASGADIEVLVQNAAGQPVANAVVYAQPPRAEVVAAPRRVNIDQVDKQFAPRVSVIQTGTMVWLPNSDNIRHSVYSISPAKPFTMKLYSGKPSEPILFDKPGIVVLGCNIHDQMAAWVLVVDTPYFARSGADGKVKLVGLPAGSYRLNVWHPSLDAAIDLRPLEVAGGVAQSLSVRIEASVLPEPIPGSSGAYNGGQP